MHRSESSCIFVATFVHASNNPMFYFHFNELNWKKTRKSQTMIGASIEEHCSRWLIACYRFLIFFALFRCQTSIKSEHFICDRYAAVRSAAVILSKRMVGREGRALIHF